MAWQHDEGHINGIDVAGRTFVILTHIPDNILKGNWRIVAYVDEGASDEQRNALLDMCTGKLGGPVADLSELVGEVLGVEQVPISFDVEAARRGARIRIRGVSPRTHTYPMFGAARPTLCSLPSAALTVGRGQVGTPVVERFRPAGYSDAALVATTLGVAAMTFATGVAHLTRPAIDAAFLLATAVAAAA